MKRGRVVGEVWATRKVQSLSGRRLKLVVEAPNPAAATLSTAPLVVAVDTLDAEAGQEVMVAYGSGARNVLSPEPDNRHILCDAAIALIVDSKAEGKD